MTSAVSVFLIDADDEFVAVRSFVVDTETQAL